MQYTHRVSPHWGYRDTLPYRRAIRLFVGIAILAVFVSWVQSWPVIGAKLHTVVALVNASRQDPTQPQVGPGIPLVGSSGPRRGASSVKAGSLLFFQKYTSDASAPGNVNSLLTITNTNPRDSVSVRVFFVHASIVEDLFITLVANQSRTLTASKESPGQTGYAFAIAVNSQGLPTQFNWLLGNASFRDGRGHEAGYNALAVSKRSGGPLRSSDGSRSADLVFDNNDYDRLPKRVAIDNLQNQDEASGPAVKTDVAIFSPMRNLSTAPAEEEKTFKLGATAYDNAGKAYAQDSDVISALYTSVDKIWTSIPINAIIGANRPGWASFIAQKGENTIPILGLSLTDGANNAMHNARVMQVLEWLDTFRMTIPIRVPENPVTDVVTQDQPDSAGGATGAGELKAGSILLYPRFVSGDYGNSQINLTNTHPTEKIRLRVFFSGLVEPAQVKESIVTLAPLQTLTLEAGDQMANQRGWVMVLAISNSALPIQFNHLIGSAQVNETTGQHASFNAIAIAKINPDPVERESDISTANLLFDDEKYDRLPATGAMAFVPSQSDNSTLLGFSRPPASLLDPPNTRGVANVMLYDELLASFGANLSRTETRLNQIRSSVLTPPITSTLQPGQHGWLKLISSTPVISWSLTMATAPFSAETNGNWRGGFSGDGNLHFLTAAESFTMKVPATNPNNHAPVAVAETIGPQIEARRSFGTIIRLDGSSSTDEDKDDVLSYEWFDNKKSVSTARIADRKLGLGSHVLSLVVTDASSVSSAPADQTLNVIDTTAPQISGLPSAIGKITDSDSGEAITFVSPIAYDMVDGNVTVVASIPSGSIFPVGKSVVTFTAKDQAGNESKATLEITLTKGDSKPQTGGIVGDKAPVMENLNDQYVKAGSVRSITLGAADADGDAVTFSLLGAPAYAQIISGDPGARNATLRIAPVKTDTAVATNVRVVANDGKGQTFTTLPFRIFINDVPNDDTGSGVGINRPPIAVIAPLPASVQATSKAGADLTLDASGSSDPDRDPLVFSWFDGDTLIARSAIAAVKLAAGMHFIKLTVFDGKDGLTTTSPIRIEVLPRPLAIEAVTPGVLNRNTIATLTVTGTGFNAGTELRFGKEGISVTNYVSIEEDKIVATIAISPTATPGFRDVFVTNSTGLSVRLRSALFVNR